MKCRLTVIAAVAVTAGLLTAVGAMADSNPFRTGSAQEPAPAKKTTNSRLFHLRFAQAEQMARLLKVSHLLSQQRIVADPRTNALWVRAGSVQLGRIASLISRLDRPAPQILIKAYIVSVNANALEELGVQFSTRSIGQTGPGDMKMDMPHVAARTGEFNLKVAELGFGQMLDVQISALASEGKGHIISSPELVAANRQPAYIATGTKIPFQEQSGFGNTSVNFKKAVLSLKVTPQLLKNKYMRLNVNVKQDAPSSLDVKGVPIIDTREIQTQALVKHGKTLVLGGIYEQSRNEQLQRIPLLSSIPWVGYFFKHRRYQGTRKELLIFVTPYVLPIASRD